MNLRRLFERFVSRRESSIADDLGYPEFCAQAARDKARFATFKSEPVYTRVLEHVSASQGADYLEIIKREYPHLLDFFDAFRANDREGDPTRHEYPPLGRMSPTTLRYIKVLGDLEHAFGDLSGLDIVEIGGGYGGQCLVASAYRGFRSYTLVDLPECLLLAQTYLDEHNVAGVGYRTMEQLSTTRSYDLVISNYAFTECTRPVQQEYMSRVLERSQRGYLTCNVITPDPYRSLTRAEILDRLPAPELVEERPLTHPQNYLIVWGRGV